MPQIIQSHLVLYGVVSRAALKCLHIEMTGGHMLLVLRFIYLPFHLFGIALCKQKTVLRTCNIWNIGFSFWPAVKMM